MSKHTPGPWVSEGECRNQRGNIIAEGRDRPGRVAFVYYDRSRFFLGEAEANARLIAAAPDLLYQMKQVESQLSCGEPFPPDAIVAIRSAIAKAEGKTK